VDLFIESMKDINEKQNKSIDYKKYTF